jgi:hypothetical protein
MKFVSSSIPTVPTRSTILLSCAHLYICLSAHMFLPAWLSVGHPAHLPVCPSTFQNAFLSYVCSFICLSASVCSFTYPLCLFVISPIPFVYSFPSPLCLFIHLSPLFIHLSPLFIHLSPLFIHLSPLSVHSLVPFDCSFTYPLCLSVHSLIPFVCSFTYPLCSLTYPLCSFIRLSPLFIPLSPLSVHSLITFVCSFTCYLCLSSLHLSFNLSIYLSVCLWDTIKITWYLSLSGFHVSPLRYSIQV